MGKVMLTARWVCGVQVRMINNGERSMEGGTQSGTMDGVRQRCTNLDATCCYDGRLVFRIIFSELC